MRNTDDQNTGGPTPPAQESPEEPLDLQQLSPELRERLQQQAELTKKVQDFVNRQPPGRWEQRENLETE